MERIRFSDVDSTDEVCKQFNKIIDHLNNKEEEQKETDEYNKKVDKYNKGLGLEKGDK